jgi:signal transduction histidine kinase
VTTRRAWLLDITLAFALTVLVQLELWLGEQYDGVPALPGNRALTAVLLLATTVPLVWRRRRPLTAFIASMSCFSLLFLIQGGGEFGGGFVVLLFGSYSAAAWSPRVLPVLGMTAVILVIHSLRDPSIHSAMDVLFPVTFVAAGLGFGWLLRRRLHRAVTAETGAAEAVAAERARLARELHDIVAHSVSVMVMQAKGGAAILTSDPDRALQALHTIEHSGREALEELRRMLGLLVEDRASETGERHAAPGLARLEELLDATRAAGVQVAIEVEGEPGRLQDVADLSAYRIVQESLTNVVRHAGTDRALVRLRWRADELELLIRDHGRGLTVLDLPSSGRGLVGMRERVTMLGGTLRAAPHREGGFEVCATLPRTRTP